MEAGRTTATEENAMEETKYGHTPPPFKPKAAYLAKAEEQILEAESRPSAPPPPRHDNLTNLFWEFCEEKAIDGSQRIKPEHIRLDEIAAEFAAWLRKKEA
jgi:hypothetical protein